MAGNKLDQGTTLETSNPTTSGGDSNSKYSSKPTKSAGTAKSTGSAKSAESSGSAGSSGKNEQKDIARPNLVEIPISEIEEKTKKKRPSGLKYNKKKKKNENQETEILVNSLVSGVFYLLSTRLGSHWAITPEESQSIAEPASKIINKYLDSDRLSEHSDAITLAISLGVVLTPRIVTNVLISKEKRKEKKQNAGNSGETISSSGGNNRTGNKQSATAPKNPDLPSIKSILEPISAVSY